jgi:hypothetical protein
MTGVEIELKSVASNVMICEGLVAAERFMSVEGDDQNIVSDPPLEKRWGRNGLA